MAKEPWEEDIYDDGEETLKRTSKLNGIKADRLLTILAIIFFVVVVRWSACWSSFRQVVANKSKQMSGFYNGETKVEQKSSAPAAQTDQAAKDDSSKMRTLKKVRSLFKQVKEAAIAARAGISIAQLEQLNPSPCLQDHGMRIWWCR